MKNNRNNSPMTSSTTRTKENKRKENESSHGLDQNKTMVPDG
jgi:hypothetical protein